MAKRKVKDPTSGSDLKFTERGNDTIVSTMPDAVHQTKNTIKASGVFGLASALSAGIRTGMSMLLNPLNHGEMVNRLQAQVKRIITHYFNIETSTFLFKEDSFKRLMGFEFNLKSPLNNILWADPECSFKEGILTVKIPDLQSPLDILFPENNNSCKIKVMVNLFALHAGYRRFDQEREFKFKLTHGLVAGMTWDFDVPEGVLCVVGIGIEFSKHTADGYLLFPYDGFNPSKICYTYFNPGTFVLPINEDKFSSKLLWNPMVMVLEELDVND
jgi:hypothetical protein